MIESGTGYFAAQPWQDLTGILEHRESKFNQMASSSGLTRKIRKAFNFYYGKHFSKDLEYRNGEIIRTGSQGELLAYATNHFRNLIKRTVIDTTAQKLAFDVSAVNEDSKSIHQTTLAEQLL